MKNTLTFFAILCFLLQNKSYSQQLVQSINDIYRLEDNKELFVNKQLKVLLKEIKPEIKTAHVFNNENAPLLLFRFTTIEQQRKKEESIPNRFSLLVYVKQSIPWNWAGRPKGKELDWTKDDANKFGDLIVSDIEIVQKK